MFELHLVPLSDTGLGLVFTFTSLDSLFKFLSASFDDDRKSGIKYLYTIEEV